MIYLYIYLYTQFFILHTVLKLYMNERKGKNTNYTVEYFFSINNNNNKKKDYN